MRRPTGPPSSPSGQCPWCGVAITKKGRRFCKGHGERWWEFWYTRLPGYVIYIFARDLFRCQKCGYEVTWPKHLGPPAGKWSFIRAQLHVDHIIPVSKGGPHILANMRTLCRRCNIGRGNRDESWEPVAVRRERKRLALWVTTNKEG